MREGNINIKWHVDNRLNSVGMSFLISTLENWNEFPAHMLLSSPLDTSFASLYERRCNIFEFEANVKIM